MYGNSKLHQWLNNYGGFAEWVGFAYWWSCIGKGMRLQAVQQLFYCYYNIPEGGTSLKKSIVIYFDLTKPYKSNFLIVSNNQV